MADYPWIYRARQLIGTAEIPGATHNGIIQNWLIRLGAWWRDDETPWCGVFVAWCLKNGAHEIPRYWMRAREWATWGVGLAGPRYGCVVVFTRQGGGHVGFVVGRDARGHLMVLGGNQGNRVSIAPFDASRAIAYRWPAGMPLPPHIDLPILHADSNVSEDES